MGDSAPADWRISVIMPAFNAASTIGATIASVRAQTVPVHEIIVGCDGCTDNTAEIARGLGATVLELPKGNGAVARNRAAAASTGDVLFLLDADDLWRPEKVEKHMEAWASHPDAGFVVDPSRRVRPNGERRGLNGAGGEASLSWEDMVDQRNWSSGSAFSVRRECWEKVTGFDENFPAMQDVEFIIRLAHDCGAGFRLAESYTDYILWEASVSKSVPMDYAMVEKLKARLPFLRDIDTASLWRTICMRNALKSGFPGCFKHFAKAGWPLGDSRMYKYAALALMRKVQH